MLGGLRVKLWHLELHTPTWLYLLRREMAPRVPHPPSWLPGSPHLLQEEQNFSRSGSLEVGHFSDRLGCLS